MARVPASDPGEPSATRASSRPVAHSNGASDALAAVGAHESEPADASTVAQRRATWLPRTFESLRDHEFRWFYVSMLGQMASMNMQLVVRGYLAYELTGSYAALGLIGLAGAVPMLLLSAFGGVAADRLPKRTVLQLGQAASLLNALALALLIFAGLMTMRWLLVSAVAQGIVMALMQPARQAMIPDVVGMQRLMNAVSLNMAGMNTMRLVAPAAGGFIIEFAGFEWAFLTMTGLYALALLAMSHVTWRPATIASEEGASIAAIGVSSLRDIGGGLRYIAGDRLMFPLLAITFLSSVFAMPYLFLLPGYVSDIFDGDGSEVGLLISMSAVGSLGGALVLASIPDRRRGLLLLTGTMVLGIGLFAFAQTANYWIAGGFIVVVGVGSALRQALSQGLLHAYVDNAYRGRVMSVFMLQFSMMQFGTFFIGLLAEEIGIRAAFSALGVGLVIVTLAAMAFVPKVRRLD